MASVPAHSPSPAHNQDLLEEYHEMELVLPSSTLPDSSNLVRITRTAKLGKLILPILNSYRDCQKRVAAKKKECERNGMSNEFFEVQRSALMDEQHNKEAPNIKNVLVSMGGLYNKGAQLLASQQMIMPARLVEELKTCFEDMPYREWSRIETALIQSLGDGNERRGKERLITEFFSIQQTPLAAASIGQVHTGVIRNGDQVVIKILYPEIRKNMYADLATMKTSIELIVNVLGLGDMKKMIDIFYAEVAENFPRELDFNIELAHMEYGRNLLRRHSKNIVVPRAYKELSSTIMLVQQYVKGETLNKVAQSKDPNKIAVARRVLDEVIDALGNMIFKDGFFHADPHPGNVMVLADGRGALIDWGQCMRLTKPQRRRLCQMVILLRTQCLELVIAGLNMSGFQFPPGLKGSTAAMIFFAFDSAINSPFASNISELGATIRNTPSKLELPTEMPREVIFFARVMQCLRRDCEILGVDISAIKRWAPVARRELRAMVYDPPLPRQPSRQISIPLPRLPSGMLSKPEEFKREPFGKEEKDEDDRSMWSPSRMLLMIDTCKFSYLADGISWLQKNPAVGDTAIEWTITIIEACPWIVRFIPWVIKTPLMQYCFKQPRVALYVILFVVVFHELLFFFALYKLLF